MGSLDFQDRKVTKGMMVNQGHQGLKETRGSLVFQA